MITIEQFDAAYQKYYEKEVEPYLTTIPQLTRPLEQVRETLDNYNPEIDGFVGGFMFFYITCTKVPNETTGITELSICAQKQIVSTKGITSLPEFLNDYISLD